MSCLALSLQFLEILFSGTDLHRLRPLLAADFKFSGPMYSFDSADAYVSALEADPPLGFGYDILGTFEKDNTAGVFYQFTKQGLAWTPPFTTPMAQYFDCKDERIVSTLLIFDRKDFDEAKAAALT